MRVWQRYTNTNHYSGHPNHHQQKVRNSCLSQPPLRGGVFEKTLFIAHLEHKSNRYSEFQNYTYRRIWEVVISGEGMNEWVVFEFYVRTDTSSMVTAVNVDLTMYKYYMFVVFKYRKRGSSTFVRWDFRHYNIILSTR